MQRPSRLVLALLSVGLICAPAQAQILPNVGQTVGGVLESPVGAVGQTTGDLTRGAGRELRQARETALRTLRQRYPEQVDTAPGGALVLRREVIAIAPSVEALAAAQARGFSVRETVDAGELGLAIVVLEAPRALSTGRAMELLREIDPRGSYEFNHVYLGAGPIGGGGKQAASNSAGVSHGARVGLIDAGVDAGHRAFSGVALTQRGFAGQARTDAHATAIASLIAGADGGFRGAAPGAALYVADVYGARPAGGGATAIVSALAWLAQQRAGVINISLVGPPNRALEAAVRAAIQRGHVIVAAVGNDGPSAPALYPASYPGVVGVTGVDARNRALPEAGRGPQVDFAAPGSDMTAAAPGGGYAPVRGTSFAAPIVAGLIARRMSAPSAEAASRAQADLAGAAQDLGARGPDRTFGAGLVGQDIRASTARVAARR